MFFHVVDAFLHVIEELTCPALLGNRQAGVESRHCRLSESKLSTTRSEPPVLRGSVCLMAKATADELTALSAKEDERRIKLKERKQAGTYVH